MKQLQHDMAIVVVRAAMAELRDYLPYEQRLMVIHRLHCCVKAGFHKYETMAKHIEPRLLPSWN